MQRMATDLKRVFVGKDVLAVLAVLLLASGMTSSSIFVHWGTLLASTVEGVVPALTETGFAVLVVAGIYLQAVIAAGVYRIVDGIYHALQERAQVGST